MGRRAALRLKTEVVYIYYVELSLMWGELGKECCGDAPRMDIRAGVSLLSDWFTVYLSFRVSIRSRD